MDFFEVKKNRQLEISSSQLSRTILVSFFFLNLKFAHDVINLDTQFMVAINVSYTPGKDASMNGVVYEFYRN